MDLYVVEYVRTLPRITRGNDRSMTMMGGGRTTVEDMVEAASPEEAVAKARAFHPKGTHFRAVAVHPREGNAFGKRRSLARENPAALAKDPATMTAGEVNRELDRLDKKRRAIGQEMIDAGRGHETYSETWKMTDPLALRWQEVAGRERDLRWEIDRRMGPGHHSRLPAGRFFGPRVKENPLLNEAQGSVFLFATVGVIAAGLVALAFRGAAKQAAALQTSANNVSYPVVVGHTYAVGIRATVPPSAFGASLQALFAAGDLATTDVPGDFVLNATATASGSLADNPPSWVVTSFVDYAPAGA